jgi:BASS family bile acid:Na+ symporter
MLSLLINTTLVGMMLRIGFDVSAAEVITTAKDYRLIVRALVANYLFIPAVTVSLLVLLHANPMVALSFLILSVCPGAPFVPPLTALARGNVSVSISLMAILAASSAIFAPLLLPFLIPLVATSESTHVNALAIIRTLGATQLLPLATGMLVRSQYSGVTAKLSKWFGIIVNCLLLVVISLVFAAYYRVLIQIPLVSVVAMMLLSVLSTTIGWFVGGAEPGNRKAMALTTSFRNAGVGMVIALGFGNSQVLLAVVAYTLLSVVGTVVPALYWGRNSTAEGHVLAH